MGGLALIVAASLSIVGIAYAESGGIFAEQPSTAPTTPVESPNPDDTVIAQPTDSADPSATPEPSSTKPAKPAPSKSPDTDAPKPKPSATTGGPATHEPSSPPPAYVPETLDQIVSAVNAFRLSRGVAAFQPLVDGCEKVTSAWSDATAGGKLSAALIAENVGPLTRAATAPAFIAAQAEWTDDGSSGGVPAVKIRVYRCVPASPSPSGSPDEG